MRFDDNADFRQKDLFALRDWTQEDPKEVEASKYQLNYIALDGNIALKVFLFLIIIIKLNYTKEITVQRTIGLDRVLGNLLTSLKIQHKTVIFNFSTFG